MCTLGISNFAFEDTPQSWDTLHSCGIRQIELAPTMLCPWTEFSAQAVRDYEAAHNIKVFSLQSLFYGLPLVIAQNFDECMAHMTRVLQVCVDAKIPKVTFGSPAARYVRDKTDEHAVFEFVTKLACKFPQVTICMEHNAAAYGCNFLTTIKDTVKFVKAVNLPNVRLQFDTGNQMMQQEPNAFTTLLDNFHLVGAVHISNPQLGDFSKETDEVHEFVATVLDLHRYNKFLSIEIRNVRPLRTLVPHVLKMYNKCLRCDV